MSTGYKSQPHLPWGFTKVTLAKLSVLTMTVAITVAVTDLVREPRAIAVDVPIVKSAVLGANLDVPWSQPVQVRDPYEGNYLAVFDRHYFYRNVLNQRTKTEVVSLWSPKSVRFLLADGNYGCFSGGYRALNGLSGPLIGLSVSGPNCVTSNTQEVSKLFIKVDQQVFRIEGRNSTFAVSDQLAKALQRSPVGVVNIRLVTRSGEAVDSEIGTGTVKAWKAIY